MKRFAVTSVVIVVAIVAGFIGLTLNGSHVDYSDRPVLVAAATGCRTVHLPGAHITAIQPSMSVPVCYNGSKVWQNGNVTGWINTYGYALQEVSWKGTYNSGGGWIGAGMNYRVTLGSNWASFSCASRWIIDAGGNVASFDRGC